MPSIAKPSKRLRVLSAVAASGLLVLVTYDVVRSQPPPSVLSTGRIPLEIVGKLPSFKLSADPNAEILTLGHFSQTTRNYRAFTLFGDQRLERVEKIDTVEPKTKAIYLEARQVLDLVRLAMLFDLVETDQGELQQRIREANSARSERLQQPGQEPILWTPAPADSSVSRFAIRLASYADSGPQANRLSTEGLDFQAEIFSEIHELRGWLLISKRLHQLFDE